MQRVKALALAQGFEKNILHHIVGLRRVMQAVANPVAQLGLMRFPGGAQVVHAEGASAWKLWFSADGTQAMKA